MKKNYTINFDLPLPSFSIMIPPSEPANSGHSMDGKWRSNRKGIRGMSTDNRTWKERKRKREKRKNSR